MHAPLRSLVALLCLALGVVALPALGHDPAAPREENAVRATRVRATGVVHVFVVNNAVRGSSHRYADLELDDGSQLPLEGPLAQDLPARARVALSGNAVGKGVDVDSVQTIAPAGSGNVSATQETEGILAVLHADDFASGKGSFIYEVHETSGRVRRMRLASLPGELAPGMRIRVAGRPAPGEPNALTPDAITVLSETSAAPASDAYAKSATANGVLVILANFNNTATPSFSPAQAQQVMTSNPDSVANFFREASYGQQLMNVSVTPNWLTMNLAQPASCGSTDFQAISSAAEAAAKQLGTAYDPASYNFVVYLFPTVPSCGWVGLGYVGYPHKAWINGTAYFRTSAIAHEMGHNFGLLHAASLRCAGSIGGSCTASEYGDPFDVMGNQSAMHYNAMQKAKLGWISAASVVTHSGGSGTYTLSPLETAGGGTYALKIPTSASNRTYWLEFRQPIGFDAALASMPNNGAQIRVASPFETLCPGCDSWSDDTQLLDMTPSSGTFADAALVAGQTFRDATYGVGVTVLSATPSALTVQVTTGGTSAATATTTTLAASANPIVTGTSVSFTATVRGNAPTGTVSYTDNGSVIAGCSAVVLVSGAAACSTSALAAGTHSIVAQYAGDAANNASTSVALAEVVNAPTGSVNVALAANGGSATASSTYGAGFAVASVIDGNRSGAGWETNGGWNDATYASFPDWVQVNFSGAKTIDHVIVYTLQDNYYNPIEPSDSLTFSRYGITTFQVQGWDGVNWVTLGTVSGNNLVKRTVAFAAYTTDRIRISVSGTADGGFSRITEIEAWTGTGTGPPPQANVALAGNGAVASASSTYSAGFAVSTVIDGNRSGAGWETNGGWNDGTPAGFPDWVQVNFNGAKTIDHVVVYTLQDRYYTPVEPSDTMTFSLYGITAFDVQGFDGANWVTLGSVTGNNLVKRTVSFAAYRTDRIRIVVTATADGAWSRITEVEAWGG